MTLPKVSLGQHNLTIFASDALGNYASPKTISFNVVAPFPTTLVITASGASLAVIGIGLLVYFKKRKH
jgi:LPXTG-motif cell wall-anchored protein